MSQEEELNSTIVPLSLTLYNSSIQMQVKIEWESHTTVLWDLEEVEYNMRVDRSLPAL